MEKINIIIKPIDVELGDTIYLSTDYKYDKDFEQWSNKYYDDFIVTQVNHENQTVQIKDCPYNVDMWAIINVER